MREAGEHHVRGFRVEIEIELGHRGDVAVAGDRAAHDHEAADALRQARIELQGQGDVGQWPQRHQQQLAGVFVRKPQQRQRRVFGIGAARGWRMTDVAETVVAVHVGRVRRSMQQRRGTAREHRHVVAIRDFAQLQRVAHGVLEPDVAGGDAEPDDVVRRRIERHQDRQRVVHAGVGVDVEGNAIGHVVDSSAVFGW